MAGKIVKKLPASESGAGVRCRTRSGKEYLISQCPEKRKHTLWKVLDGGLEKLSTADSPMDLYKLIPWEK